MAACTAFWYGASLGPVERACIRSLIRHGSSLALYTYREVAGVPQGVEIRDAATILPEGCLFLHRRTGSPAPFADWFRYVLQKQGAGTWVDLDLYFVAPLDAEHPYLFGWQEPGVINNAVLRLPPDSPLTALLLGMFQGSRMIPGLSLRQAVRDRLNRLLSPESRLELLPWGATGPTSLTALARKLGLAGHAVPAEVFYPVPWRRADWIADPAIPLERVVGPRTVAVHLWNAQIAHLKREAPPAGSFLARLMAEGEP